MEVPIATKVMAVSPGLIPKTHPISPASSPAKYVVNPIMASEPKKQG